MPDVALIHGRINPRLILAVKPEKSFILNNVDVFQMGIFGRHTGAFLRAICVSLRPSEP